MTTTAVTKRGLRAKAFYNLTKGITKSSLPDYAVVEAEYQRLLKRSNDKRS